MTGIKREVSACFETINKVTETVKNIRELKQTPIANIKLFLKDGFRLSV